MIGACAGLPAVRSRALPLWSGQVGTGAPSAYCCVSASNQSSRPVVTGGPSAGAPAAVAADTTVADPTAFVAVTPAGRGQPRSPRTILEVRAVAAGIAAQPPPRVLHRGHREP